ncbi:HipA N-terminal domain-containing protein [Flavicella sp.]|uniref:HipA N-terminal domain-containing protein n=1 Tax=Flavicella sp. TaxID=2957742 RepID=UPI00261E8B3B|nr:HipA N-terminal domain-containing protein [Flavicella sp.]MDG1803480.1 HipA N-terminal domain-containing protein [Flavicella sp.]MDG2279126.1 HipA N-terminal domain-containing protein [Flavicella sp.]
MRQAQILYGDINAGILTETDHGEYTFEYNQNYIENYPKQFISFSFPVTATIYKEKRLFPFFEGLIPEGWLLDIATKNWKINSNDRMGLLLACCNNCIGAVSVHPLKQDRDE